MSGCPASSPDDQLPGACPAAPAAPGWVDIWPTLELSHDSPGILELGHRDFRQSLWALELVGRVTIFCYIHREKKGKYQNQRQTDRVRQREGEREREIWSRWGGRVGENRKPRPLELKKGKGVGFPHGPTSLLPLVPQMPPWYLTINSLLYLRQSGSFLFLATKWSLPNTHGFLNNLTSFTNVYKFFFLKRKI